MKKARQIIGGFVLLLVLFVMVGCQSAPPSGLDFSSDPLFTADPLSGDGTNPPSPFIFKAQDPINVTFIGPDQPIPPYEGRVSEDGTISLPLIGVVKVAGKASGELQKEIHDAYVPKYYLRLTVTVRGQDRVYYVGGEVKSPNRFVWAGEITLTKAIQTAGDFNDWAQKKKVYITRANGTSVGPIDCVRILEGKIPDPPIYPGDKIYVRRRGI